MSDGSSSFLAREKRAIYDEMYSQQLITSSSSSTGSSISQKRFHFHPSEQKVSCMSTIQVLPIVQQYLSWYAWPICLIVGLIGCSLNVLLFSRRQFRSTSCCLCKVLRLTNIECLRLLKIFCRHLSQCWSH